MSDESAPFVPKLFSPRLQGFYTIPDRLKPLWPPTELHHRNPLPDGTGGWIDIGNGETTPAERLANGLLAILAYPHRWCGISREFLDVAIEQKDPDVFRWITAVEPSQMITDLLSQMEADGWIEQIPREDGVLIIYVTSRLLERVKR
jgi:hypothetical protein